MPYKHMECGPKCRSRKHAYELNAAISKGNLREIQSYSALCYNGALLNDIQGRSALHIAAGCGKVDVIEWLLEEKQGDVTQKDLESGWTALHRAIFYGQLASARLLVQYKSDLYTRDHEGLGPLDIAMKDRMLISRHSVAPPVYERTDPHEVFTWGDNSNFTLGHVTEQRRHTPEVVDEFRKHNVRILQIVMCMYHTVFLTVDNKVYTCGHGLGGRLGHSTEETCLVPKMIEAVSGEVCVEVAAAKDHTLFLTSSGLVYSCGMNDYHQLGQVPVPDKCLVPKPVNCKMVKGLAIKGVCAGRFHSVLYTSHSVFTCGLNAGQLGHPKAKGDCKISQLRQVSALNIKELTIVSVKCSDAATIILTEAGEIYVLHEYQCRKIASNRSDIRSLYVVGGNLDHTDSQVLRERGGQQLVISILNHSGKVFIWREKSPSLKRAHWLIRRLLHVVDFVLTESGLAIVTDMGEVYVCTLTSKPPPVREASHSVKEQSEGEFGSLSLMDLLLQEETEEVQVHRVPGIHRAMYITADRKGYNFATLQVQPNFSLTDIPSVSSSEMRANFRTLFEEADEYDLIHDLIIQVDDHRWPVHKFILMNRCVNFSSLLSSSLQTDNSSVPALHIRDIHPQIVEQLLLFVYTDTCDLLSVGAEFMLDDKHDYKREDIFQMDMDGNDFDITSRDSNRKVSAFEVHQKSKGKKGKGGGQKGPAGQGGGGDKNPVKMLQEVARKWGVKGLSKRLDCVRCVGGQVVSSGKKQPSTSLHFYRDKMKDTKFEMFDVTIQSEDGVMFQCHKCVLVARLEYFHSMLASGWMETSSTTALTLPVPGDILEVLLDFLYTDDSQVVNNCQNAEFLCNILVVADQMLVIRLKEKCEAAVTALITLKNVGELLEFASLYNAGQLRSTCQQYIILNLASLLEGGNLDVLSDEVMEELTAYYRQSIENMSRRMITPYDEGPDKRYLEALAAEADDTETGSQVTPVLDFKKSKGRKKRNRTKSITEEQEKVAEKGLERGSRRISERLLSVGSDVSVKSDEDFVDVSEELTVDCLVDAKSPPSITSPGPWDRKPPPCSPSHPLDPCLSPESPRQTPGIWESAASPHRGNGGGLSLRDIMKQEQLHNTTMTVKSSSTKTGKFSWKEAKKHQQQQLKQQQQNKNNKNTNSSGSVPTQGNMGVSPGTETSSPWGSLNKVVQSFRSLMVEEQVVSQSHKSAPQQGTSVREGGQRLAPSTQGGGIKQGSSPVAQKQPHGSKSGGKSQGSGATSIVSWGLPTSGKSTPKVKIPSRLEESQMGPKSPDNPWGMSQGAQSPIDTTCSFSEILKDEIHKIDVLVKTSNKPLALIQIEEQAINDLLRLYEAEANVDEKITVERVTEVSATPLWKRERLQST